jgi:hypothetical protein
MDCADPDQLAKFWAEALGFVIPDPPEGHATWEDFLRSMNVPEEEWNSASAIQDSKSDPTRRIYFQKVPEPKAVKNRLHLDLNVAARGTPAEERRTLVDAEVERLAGIGASKVEAREKYDEYWVVMQDVEGNEFCLQ